jgi:hypothetical protein
MIISITLFPSACSAFVHPDLAAELISQINELHRRPGVQPKLVAHDDFAGNDGHCRLPISDCRLR